MWVTKLLLQLVLMGFGIEGPTHQDKNEFWVWNLERLDKISNNMLESRDWEMEPYYSSCFYCLLSCSPSQLYFIQDKLTLSLILHGEIEVHKGWSAEGLGEQREPGPQPGGPLHALDRTCARDDSKGTDHVRHCTFELA